MVSDELVQEAAEVELQDDVLVDILTGEERKRTEKEETIQRMIQVLAQEYHFPLETMKRDVPVSVELDGKRRAKIADLVVCASGEPQASSAVARIVVVQPPATKASDSRKGVELLKDLLYGASCEFGLWTNGRDVSYLQQIDNPIDPRFEELSDFPGNGETLEDLNRQDRQVAPRVAVGEDLRETVLRCHDYLYGNQAMTGPRAFAELVKLIFCKIYDERLLRTGKASRRQFWVGVTERNTPGGQRAIAERIKGLFEQVKRDTDLAGIFKPGDEIELEPRHLAWIAGELARYQFLDADVDVKGMAYEAMVATTMKRERGQFFTPRNVVQAMVEILAPGPDERVLDPACGSARFLVACMDRFRRVRAEEMGTASVEELRRRSNSPEIVAESSGYAGRCLFGVDVDPELQRAAKMNMFMNNDGHGNLFVANSLEITTSDIAQKRFAGAERLAFNSFDVVLTNPPFGTRIPVDDPNVLRQYDLAHVWRKAPNGVWMKQEGTLKSKVPPEILFIERCMQWLKPGGRMGIVVPDGILGNPDNEPIRWWILQHARVLASIDLPVEAFLPQVGVQASLLFLRKKTQAELSSGQDPDYGIFMAIAEFVGHDRRGNTIYRRDADGYDLYETYEIDLPVLKGGREVIETRHLRRKTVADDLPRIADAYYEWASRLEGASS